MDHERKEHFMLRNKVRSMGESRSLSLGPAGPCLSVRHNMSELGIKSSSVPSFDHPEMFNRHCSKLIMREKSTLCWGTQLGARKKFDLSLDPFGPCLLNKYGSHRHDINEWSFL